MQGCARNNIIGIFSDVTLKFLPLLLIGVITNRFTVVTLHAMESNEYFPMRIKKEAVNEVNGTFSDSLYRLSQQQSARIIQKTNGLPYYHLAKPRLKVIAFGSTFCP